MARRALILDLFGVIVDNPHFLSYFLIPEMRGKEGYPHLKEVYFDVCEGRASERDFANALAEYKIDYESRLEFATSKMVEFIDRSLFSLDSIGDVFLYTHFYSRPLRIFLQKSALDSSFRFVFCTDNMAMNKESGFSVVKNYLESHGYMIEDAIVVDDKKNVLQAAKQSGFGITLQKITEPVKVSELDADFVISRLEDIHKVVPY